MAAGISYDCREGRAIAGAISAVMTGVSYAASAEMAGELGPFPEYAANQRHAAGGAQPSPRRAWRKDRATRSSRSCRSTTGAKLVLDGRQLALSATTEGTSLARRYFTTSHPIWTCTRMRCSTPLVVLRTETLDAAVEPIADNAYGNGAAIFTQSGHAARRFAREVEAGRNGWHQCPGPGPGRFYSLAAGVFAVGTPTFTDLRAFSSIRLGKVVTSRGRSRAPGVQLLGPLQLIVVAARHTSGLDFHERPAERGRPGTAPNRGPCLRRAAPRALAPRTPEPCHARATLTPRRVSGSRGNHDLSGEIRSAKR